jgi:uncharacterized protein YgiM (DUF1202 family)
MKENFSFLIFGGHVMKTNTLAISAVALATLPFIANSAKASTISSQSYSPFPQPRTGFVDAASLNVRSEPTTASKILGSLLNKTSISVLGQTGNWYKIQYNNQEAYVHKSYVSFSSTQGTQQYIVNTDTLNVRSQPSIQSSILGLLRNGQIITVQSEQNGWAKISYNGQTAYVSKDFVSPISQPLVEGSSTVQGGQQYTVNTNMLNVRSQPSVHSPILGLLRNGQIITVQSEQNGWAKISYNGQTAYVSKDFVSPASQPSGKENSVKPLSSSTYYVDCTSLRMRTGPGTNYQILKVLGNRQQIEVIGETGDWYKVRSSSIEGFVSKQYVKPLQGSSQTTSSFIFPAAAGHVSSPFGMRSGGMHYGVDLAASGNVQIYAAAAGTVSRSYYSSSYGNVVFITHKINGQLYTTVYAHMKNRAVKEGDTVRQGQLIGYMGNTGDSDGQHLHFELHKGEWNFSKTNAIDPLPYIKR